MPQKILKPDSWKSSAQARIITPETKDAAVTQVFEHPHHPAPAVMGCKIGQGRATRTGATRLANL